MRACHPASKTGDRVRFRGVLTPHAAAFKQRNHGATGLPNAKQAGQAAPGIYGVTQLVTFGSNVHEWEKAGAQAQPGRSRTRCWPSASTMVHSA